MRVTRKSVQFAHQKYQTRHFLVLVDIYLQSELVRKLSDMADEHDYGGSGLELSLEDWLEVAGE